MTNFRRKLTSSRPTESWLKKADAEWVEEELDKKPVKSDVDAALEIKCDTEFMKHEIREQMVQKYCKFRTLHDEMKGADEKN
jgi:hypothetical protein